MRTLATLILGIAMAGVALAQEAAGNRMNEQGLWPRTEAGAVAWSEKSGLPPPHANRMNVAYGEASKIAMTGDLAASENRMNVRWTAAPLKEAPKKVEPPRLEVIEP
jgi:hypothetical protein